MARKKKTAVTESSTLVTAKSVEESGSQENSIHPSNGAQSNGTITFAGK